MGLRQRGSTRFHVSFDTAEIMLLARVWTNMGMAQEIVNTGRATTAVLRALIQAGRTPPWYSVKCRQLRVIVGSTVPPK